MTAKQIVTDIVICVVALTAAFAAGRYTVPTKVETHTEFVDRFQRIQLVQVRREIETKYKRVVVTKPDGSSVSTEVAETHENDNSSNTTVTQNTEDKSSQSTKTSTSQNWTISVTGGFQLTSGQISSGTLRPVFGIHATRKILGPLLVSGYALTSGTFGLGVGLSL